MCQPYRHAHACCSCACALQANRTATAGGTKTGPSSALAQYNSYNSYVSEEAAKLWLRSTSAGEPTSSVVSLEEFDWFVLESHEGVVAVLAVVVERMRNYFAWQARLQFINRCVARNEDTAEDARRRDFEQARTNGDAGKGGGDGAEERPRGGGGGLECE